MSADLAFALKTVVAGHTLTADATANAFAEIMRAKASPLHIAAFLTALAMREPSVEELTGAARAMRAAMTPVAAPDGTIDMCGTGGDGHNTYNISTAAALIVAACGVTVAKHGNRSASSQSGTADVLEALGIAIDRTPEAAAHALQTHRFAFLFAPAYHGAMSQVAPVRKALGFRTIFNLLGPLANPAGVKRQLLGVPSPQWVDKFAHVLRALGSQTALIVHGSDGLDELTTTGPTYTALLDRGEITSRDVLPEVVSVARTTLSELKGGNAQHNAAALRAVLANEGPSAYRDIAILNAAAGLLVADAARTLEQGADLARAALSDGRASALLRALSTAAVQP